VTSDNGEPLASGAKPTLERRLGFISLTVYGLGNMLGAGIYGTIGVAAKELGNALWLAFAASVVAAGLTGLSYACLGSRYPRAAGAAYITERAFGSRFLTYVIGLTIMCSGLTSMATASHVFGSHFLSAVGLSLSASGAEWAVRGVVLPFLLAIAFVNFWGIRESALLNAVCTLVESAGLVFIVVIGLRFVGSVDYLDATAAKNPGGEVTVPLVLGGAVLAFFSFIGFEDLLNISEEVKNPERTLPLALVSALALATVIYMAVSIVAVSVVPARDLAGATKPALYLVAERAAPWMNARWFAVIAMFAVANTALLNYIMGSRLLYGMARQRLLPQILGKIHPRRHTPHVAILALLGIVLLLVLVGSISALAQATSLLLLASFTVVNVALIVLKLRPEEPRGRFEVPVVVPGLGALVCLGMLGNGVRKMLLDYGEQSTRGVPNAFSALLPLLIALALVGIISLLYLVVRPNAAVAHDLD
jgi:amino acid transporter